MQSRKLFKAQLQMQLKILRNIRLAEEDLFIKEIFVTEGPTLKRFKPRARGRADRVLKRSSHITVFVSDGKDKATVEKRELLKRKLLKEKLWKKLLRKKL